MDIKKRSYKYVISFCLYLCSIVIVVALMSGCTVETDVETGKMVAVRKQYLEYDQVKERLDKLYQGMRVSEVLLLLGSPAQRKGDEWIYLPNRPSWVIPGEAIHIQFRRNTYVSHRFVPIILGEEITP